MYGKREFTQKCLHTHVSGGSSIGKKIIDLIASQFIWDLFSKPINDFDSLERFWYNAGKSARDSERIRIIQENRNLFYIDENGTFKFREADIHNAITDCVQRCPKTTKSPGRPGIEPPPDYIPLISNCKVGFSLFQR